MSDRSVGSLIMMGTGDFAVPTFRRLLEERYPVRLLVTQPDRPQGRHQQLVPAVIKQVAVERGIDVFQPENVNSPESIEHIASFQPDVAIVAAYGQILSDDLLRVPRWGGLNLHASLLPRYRGAAPVNWAIYHGESATGVTVIRMTPRIDAGEMVLQAETPIGPEETAGELEERLAVLGAPLVCQAIDALAAGTLTGRKQDRSLVTRAPKLKKEHGLIDWSRTAPEICNQVRAMQPWPMAFTFLHRPATAAERMVIERASVRSGESLGGKPGAVHVTRQDDSGHEMLIVTTGGPEPVAIERVRPAGKRSMTAADFLRGHRIGVGSSEFYFASIESADTAQS